MVNKFTFINNIVITYIFLTKWPCFYESCKIELFISVEISQYLFKQRSCTNSIVHLIVKKNGFHYHFR